MDECDGDPTFRCRYETLSFMKGKEIMDGDRALAYVRSRHSQGDDGNDFSRGRRQQDVLVAVKNKLITSGVWSNPKIVMQLFRTFRETITTDLSLPECIALGKMMMKYSEQSIKQVTLEKELQDASVDLYGRFALIPLGTHDDFTFFIHESIWNEHEKEN
jgi:anionic cell wall polymer biosynthesis LytR-Cps2A-Psr (LCP) family protein